MANRDKRMRRRGFTLMEMLVATALVLILGGMAVATLGYGMELWRSGHRRSYAYDTAAAVFHQMRDDIGAARSQFWNQDEDAYDRRIQFIVDEDDYDPGPGPSPRQRLRFVRAIPDAGLNPRLREAGDGVDNDAPDGGRVDEELYNLLDDDDDGQVDEDLTSLEGRCEVAYMRGMGAGDSYTLYRALLGPIGGSGSLFEDVNVANPGAVGLALTEEVVLHFELRLWSQYTTTWDDSAPFSVWPDSVTPQYCGPALTWDSDGNDPDPDAVRDNVFPRAVMAVIVVEPPERLRPPSRLRLAMGISEDADEIRVQGSLPAYNRRWRYLLIRDPSYGDEWVRFSRFDPVTQEFVIDTGTEAGRGVRGTTAVAHAADCDVLLGYTLTTVFHNPSGREYWGQ